MPKSLFAVRLHAIKEARNLSPRELADMSGLSRSYINHLLAGAKEPSWESVCKIANALGVSTEEFREKAAAS